MNRWSFLAFVLLASLAAFFFRPDPGGEADPLVVAVILAVLALTFVYGYRRGRWRALVEATVAALLLLSSDFLLLGVGVYEPGPENRDLWPGMALVLALPVVLPLIACGVAARRRQRARRLANESSLPL